MIARSRIFKTVNLVLKSSLASNRSIYFRYPLIRSFCAHQETGIAKSPACENEVDIEGESTYSIDENNHLTVKSKDNVTTYEIPETIPGTTYGRQ